MSDERVAASGDAPPFTLTRDDSGRLVHHDSDGSPGVGVVPVRAFPISAPDEGISLVGADGREVAWIARLSHLPAALRESIESGLAAREFVPEIRQVHAVTGFITPCTWYVTTDRGDTRFVLRGEESIRRLSPATLLIADSDGIHYLVRDLGALDRASRKIIDRFM